MRIHLEKCSIGLLRSIFATLNCSLELDKWWLQFHVGLWGYKAIMCIVRNEWEIAWFMANLNTHIWLLLLQRTKLLHFKPFFLMSLQFTAKHCPHRYWIWYHECYSGKKKYIYKLWVWFMKLAGWWEVETYILQVGNLVNLLGCSE